ncbi:MAG: hypothetical protein ACYC8T_23555 [Myxococcaceae bacterium]
MNASRFGLAAILAALVTCACGPAPAPAEQPLANDEYVVTQTLEPLDRHTGDVLTAAFTVVLHGAPVGGLSPQGSFKHLDTGTSKPLELTAAATEGSYSGSRALFATGMYQLIFKFKEPGGTVARSFDFADH